MKKCFLAICISISLQVLGEEEQALPLQTKPQILQDNKFLFGSLSFIPGGGISDRSRTGSDGTAIDYKVGILFIPFDSVQALPVLSVDYNFLYFFRPAKETSFYLSYGLGAAYFIPYVPLRAGLQTKYGFIDVGAKMVGGFFPSPEVRGGMNLKF